MVRYMDWTENLKKKQPIAKELLKRHSESLKKFSQDHFKNLRDSPTSLGKYKEMRGGFCTAL